MNLNKRISHSGTWRLPEKDLIEKTVLVGKNRLVGSVPDRARPEVLSQVRFGQVLFGS